MVTSLLYSNTVYCMVTLLLYGNTATVW